MESMDGIIFQACGANEPNGMNYRACGVNEPGKICLVDGANVVRCPCMRLLQRVSHIQYIYIYIYHYTKLKFIIFFDLFHSLEKRSVHWNKLRGMWGKRDFLPAVSSPVNNSKQ